MENNTRWREDAIQYALSVEARDGSSEDALLRQIRRHRPGSATLMTWLDRLTLRRFLDQETPGFRSLLAGEDTYGSQENMTEKRPYTGWYTVEWQGEPIEITLAPESGRSGYVIFAAARADALHDFADRAAAFALRPTGRSLRYTEGWEEAPDLDAEIGKVVWDDIVLPPQTLTDVRAAVEGFFDHRDTYQALGFAWKRGILLVGPPGTGKTMICKAAAASFPDLPFLYVRDLREYDKQEALEAVFRRARRLAPCILAFEDMDGLIGNENRTVFLNEMDGFQSNEGLLVIASSNHPGKIDEALLKRPSRFDRVFHIALPAATERREFCRRLLSRPGFADRLAPSVDVEELADQVADRSDGFTPAYLKEAFVAAALQQAQAGETTLGAPFTAAVLAQIEDLRQHLRRMRDPDFLAEMTTGSNGIGFRR